MFLYFDKNGIIRGQINNNPFRVGNEKSNVIYACFEKGTGNDFITSAEIKFKYEDGRESILFGMRDVSDGEFVLRPEDFTYGTDTNISPFIWGKDYVRDNKTTVLKFQLFDELIVHGNCEITIIGRKGELDLKQSFAMNKINVYIEDNIYTSLPDDEIYETIRDELDRKVDWGKAQFSIGVSEKDLIDNNVITFLEYLNKLHFDNNVVGVSFDPKNYILNFNFTQNGESKTLTADFSAINGKVDWGEEKYSIGVTREELDRKNSANFLSYLLNTYLKEYIKKITYDENTYTFTFTKQNDEELIVELPFKDLQSQINSIKSAYIKSANYDKQNFSFTFVDQDNNPLVINLPIKTLFSLIEKNERDIRALEAKHKEDVDRLECEVSYNRIGLMVVSDYDEESGEITYLYNPDLIRYIDTSELEETGYIEVHTNPLNFNENRGV